MTARELRRKVFNKQRPPWEHNTTGVWQTTKRPEGPTGRRVSGTFKDVSLIGASPEYIDAFDQICALKGMARSAFEDLMLEVNEPDPREFLDWAKGLTPDPPSNL